MFKKLKLGSEQLKHQIKNYQLLLKDKRTPLLPKLILGSAIAYLISPIDLIPDFLPIIGHVDDLIIVPALVFIAIKLIPKELTEEYKVKNL